MTTFYKKYTDPHDPNRVIEVKAVTRAIGHMPGQPVPAGDIEPHTGTEVLLDGGRVATIGHHYGYTDNGPKLLPLYFAITKGGKETCPFKSYSTARHWLWLDSEARESREYRLANQA